MTKINPSGTRFTSMNEDVPHDKYYDYNLWTELSKGLGNKSYKAITDNGNLIYIIEK